MFNKKLLYGAFLYSYGLLLSLPLACSNAYAEGIALQGLSKQSYMAKFLYNEYVKDHTERPAFSAPKGWTYECYSTKNVPVERLSSKKTKSKKVVLQLHGGAYIYGLSNWYRSFAVKQADIAHASQVYLVDYRLAPEHKYPAALEDAIAVYEQLLLDGINPKDIIIMGDSAGGNLALALSLYLRDNNMKQPQCLILMSPWTTMKENLPSRAANYEKDLILGSMGADAQHLKLDYANGEEGNPYVSPLYANLKGLAPMLIQTGSYDLLLDDSRLLAEAAKKYGVIHKLSIYPEVPHVFQVMLPMMLESKNAYSEIEAFVKATRKQ